MSLSTIHGIRHKRFALGIGLGYDVYQEWRTLPLFGSLAYDFFRYRGNSFFIQLNGGYSKAWYSLADEDQFTYKEKGGIFLHPLVGYRIYTPKIDVYLTAGYKFQRLTYDQTPKWWAWGYPRNKITVDRDIERLSIQIGLGFH